MSRSWISGFVAGCVATALVVLGLSLLPWPQPAQAQLPDYPNEHIQLMRDMSASLKGVERALQQKCP